MLVSIFSAKSIFSEAWGIAQHHKKDLFWFGFLPAFASLAIGSVLVYYQTILIRNSQLFSDHPKTMVEIIKPTILWVFSEFSLLWILVGGLFIIFCYLFLPVFSEGAVISMVRQYKHEGKMDAGWTKGVLHFLPLFEFFLLKNSLKPFPLIFEFLFALRMMGASALVFLQPLFLGVLCFSFLFLFLFSYASQFIVLKNLSAGSGIAKSMRMAVLFLRPTFTMLLLYLLIELRVIFNVLVILFLPILMVTIGGLFLHTLIGFFAEGILALILLVLASIISGTVFLLGDIAWTLAYLRLSERKEMDEVMIDEDEEKK